MKKCTSKAFIWIETQPLKVTIAHFFLHTLMCKWRTLQLFLATPQRCKQIQISFVYSTAYPEQEKNRTLLGNNVFSGKISMPMLLRWKKKIQRNQYWSKSQWSIWTIRFIITILNQSDKESELFAHGKPCHTNGFDKCISLLTIYVDQMISIHQMKNQANLLKLIGIFLLLLVM